MAIQGTGTIDDPYLVATPGELRAKVVEDFCYIKLKNDIDFNNDTVLWGWETLELKCAQIDGDNHKITNCYVYQKSFMTNHYGRNTNAPVIKNTIIEAIYFSGSTQSSGNISFVSPYITFTESQGAIYFYDCDFRIKFYVEKDEALLFDTFYSASNTGYYYRRCIFNIDVFANNHQSITIFKWSSNSDYQGEVKNCEIKINLHLANSLFTGKKVFNTDTSSSSTFNTILRVFHQPTNTSAIIGFENNAVFINIDGVNEDLPTRLCIGLAYNGKNISNCYYILGDVKGSNYLAEKELDFKIQLEGIASSCFVNDKATFYNTNLINKDSNMHVLTDAQCKNMQELLNIGFLIV